MKRLLILLLALSLLASGCSAAQPQQDDRSIKIAVMDTEDVFVADASYMNGITMAIEDLNLLYGEMGYDISYQFYEDGAVFQQGMSVINEIISDPEIIAVVGTSSLNILDVAADVFNDAGKLLITYYSSSDSLFENGYQYVFRNCYGEEDLGSAVAAYAAGREDMQRIAVYHSDTDYERKMVRTFLRTASDGGLTVADIATTTPLDPELDALVERWQLLDIDTIFVSQYHAEDAFEILERVRTTDPDINVLGDFSFDYTDFLLEYGEVSDGIYIAAPVPLEPSREVDDFYRRYREKFGSEPNQWAIQLYDSVRLVVDTAIRTGSSDPEVIAGALRSEQGYTGIGGKLTFDAQGRLTGRMPRIQVSESGRFIFVEG